MAAISPAICITACSPNVVRDATKAELLDALQVCGIEAKDVRAGSADQTAWVWYWHHDHSVNSKSMNCVRDRLAQQSVKADIYDSTIAGKAAK